LKTKTFSSVQEPFRASEQMMDILLADNSTDAKNAWYIQIMRSE